VKSENPVFKDYLNHRVYSKIKILVFYISFVLLTSVIYTQNNSIIFLTSTDIETLDPALSSDFYSGEVLNNIFEGLVRAGKDYNSVEPSLAVGWKSFSGGKIWEFDLRKGVRFHNGREFDSEDVLYTFNSRLKNPEKYKYWNLFYISILEKIEKISKYKIRFVLKKPYIPFLFQLSTTTALIIPKNSFLNRKFEPIGTGPFKFVKWDRGRFVTIARNMNYWEKKINIARVVFKIVTDPAWRLLQIRKNKGDVTVVESYKEYTEIRERKVLNIISKPSLSIHYLGFNMKKAPMSKLKVRRAIAHLIDKKKLVKHILQNFAKNVSTPVPSGIFGFNKDIKDYQFDINKAKKLIAQAGIKKNITLELAYSFTSKNLERFANAFLRSARKINITIRKRPMNFSDLRKKLDAGNYDMFMLGWQGNIPDPDVFLYPIFSNRKGNVNRTGYENPLLNSLLERGRIELNPVKRRKIYFRIQKIIHNDLPWIPLYNQNDIIVYNSSISNIRINRFSYIFFKDCIKEEN